MSQSSEAKLFQTKRSELLAMYEKNGVPFLATTRGLHSVRSLKFEVASVDANGVIGWLVAKKGQVCNFFNYGIGDAIELAGEASHRASEGDTSLTKGSRTTASADLSIEWITMHPRSIKVQYAAASLSALLPAATTELTAALLGAAPIVDPFSMAVPSAVGSSATLQHVLYGAVAPCLTCRFEWDNADRTEKMGTCDQFVEGGGASYLYANGEPSVNNRFRIPEGFLWAREGQPASELQVICTLQNDIVIPYTPVANLLGAPPAAPPTMNAVYVEIMMRLGGMLLRVPGSN